MYHTYTHTHTHTHISSLFEFEEYREKTKRFSILFLGKLKSAGRVLFRVNFRHVESQRPGSTDDTRNFPFRYATTKLFNSSSNENTLTDSIVLFVRTVSILPRTFQLHFATFLFTDRHVHTYVHRHVRTEGEGQIVRCIWSQFEFLFRDAKEQERNRKKKKKKKKKKGRKERFKGGGGKKFSSKLRR